MKLNAYLGCSFKVFGPLCFLLKQQIHLKAGKQSVINLLAREPVKGKLNQVTTRLYAPVQ